MNSSCLKILLILLLSWFYVFSNGQKIFPNAMGYGSDSRGAYAGGVTPKILIVDTMHAGELKTSENSGSFEWCVKQNYPRIVVFKVGGVIDYTNTNQRTMFINNPYLNVYGQTAPYPGVTINSCSIFIRANDMLFQHIAVRYGDAPKIDGSYEVQDCLTITENGYNVVIDHCSFSWSQDEIVGNYGNNTTFSNCLMYEPLHYSLHADEYGVHHPEPHGYGPLISIYGRFAFLRNFLGWTTNRNPRLSVTNFVNINNYVYSNSYYGPDVSGSKGDIKGVFIGNVNRPTEGINHYLTEYSTYIRSNVSSSSIIYFEDNDCLRKLKGYSEKDCVRADAGPSRVNDIYATDIKSTGMDMTGIRVMPSNEVKQYVIDSVGARYWDREDCDRRAINNFINGTQDFINSQDPLPARAYNEYMYDGWETKDGNMENGYNFANNPISFTINEKQITLNSNLTSQKQVLDAINAQVPAGVEAIDHPHTQSYHLVIQSKEVGSLAKINVQGDDLRVFGIYPNEYVGSDGIGGFPSYSTVTNEHFQLPSKPHEDDNNNGYTNIEEWVFNIDKDLCSTLKVNHEIKEADSGENNGTIKLNVTGGTPPYSYKWSDITDNTEQRTGLSVGLYSVVVTDQSGCTIEKSITISELADPCVNFSLSVNKTDCNQGESNGEISLSGTNGKEPYVYDWSDIDDDIATRINLNPGKYDVIVTDNNNCFIEKNITIAQIADPCIDFDAGVSSINCNEGESNGSISISCSGGKEPYSYKWTDFNESVANRENLNPGDYNVTISDLNGCIIERNIVIAQIDDPCIDFSVAINTTECNEGESNGAINLICSGGTEPYSYKWDDVTDNVSYRSSLLDGNYSVLIIDEKGCKLNKGIVVNKIVKPADELNRIDIVSYSNSTNREVKMVYKSEKDVVVDVTVLDSSDKVVQNFKQAAVNGVDNIIIIDLLEEEDGEYKIVLEDENGAKASSFITKEPKEVLLELLKYFPSPTAGLVAVEYKVSKNRTVYFRVLDELGQELLNFTKEAKAGTNKAMIDFKEFENGIYTVLFSSELIIVKFEITKQ
ncbi:hypothetical protein [Labilibacter marinus]|uniref:hypothetical protein n=1 Tax=Labilibacter marinus TaxID=1477105 RepID=UPI000829CD03|nr:hypothetical protein [Labilibacter marinus]